MQWPNFIDYLIIFGDLYLVVRQRKEYIQKNTKDNVNQCQYMHKFLLKGLPIDYYPYKERYPQDEEESYLNFIVLKAKGMNSPD